MSITSLDTYQLNTTEHFRKQLLDKFDESEAEELVENGTVKFRKHPRNPSRLQYQFVHQTETKESEVSDKVSGVATVETDQHSRAAIESRFRVKKHLDSSSEDESGQPSKRKKIEGPKGKKPTKELKEPNEPAAPKLKLSDECINETGDDDGMLSLHKKLISKLDGQVLQAKSLMTGFKGTMYATLKKVKDIEACITFAQTCKQQQEDAVVQEKPNKKTLVKGWECSKDLHKEIQAMEKIRDFDTASTSKYSAK